MNLTIDYPPSVNNYWRHTSRGTFLTPRAKSYRVATFVRVREQCNPLNALAGPLRVSIVARPPDRRMRDLDNLLKATLDSLAHAGVYGDDSQIHELSMRWGEQIKDGSLQISVEEIQPESIT